MAKVPSVSTPGVFSKPDEREPHINDIADLMNDDPESAAANAQLAHDLEFADTQDLEDRAWQEYTDRIKRVHSRAKQTLSEVEPDEHEQGISA